ncbi:MAG TPA: FhaA domain-containing protein [Candidatus Dormibacteraeota bacterium]|nr:FhaA domain-containing protein [Candidatus Dormibacteraeota bacterium]
MAALERFFERIFERQTARLFRTRLQPIQLQRRLERSMESARHRDGERTLVPNRYAIHLAPADLEALRAVHPNLAADLADAALAFARGHGFTLADRPTVALVADATVETADVRIAVTTDHRRDEAADSNRGIRAAEPADAAAPERRDDDQPPPTEHTAVFVVPMIESSRATLREIRPDGSSRSIVAGGRPLTIGRASDNGLVLADSRASRHHARLYGRRGALVLTDLGSTNGSWVNDRRIDEMALGEGDRIRIGDTILIVESVEPVDEGDPLEHGSTGVAGTG